MSTSHSRNRTSLAVHAIACPPALQETRHPWRYTLSRVHQSLKTQISLAGHEPVSTSSSTARPPWGYKLSLSPIPQQPNPWRFTLSRDHQSLLGNTPWCYTLSRDHQSLKFSCLIEIPLAWFSLRVSRDQSSTCYLSRSHLLSFPRLTDPVDSTVKILHTIRWFGPLR